MSAPPPSGGRSAELARLLATLGWVTAAAALMLAALGAAPAWLAGEPRSVHAVEGVDDAERRLGAPLAVPGYFPSRLGWPPASVRIGGGRGGGAALRFTARAGGAVEVELIQATTPGEPIPEALLGAPVELSSSPADVAGHPARLSRVLLDGAIWQQLAWRVDRRAMVLRSRGGLDELLLLARGVRREGARP